jgi:hypothetical protein
MIALLYTEKSYSGWKDTRSIALMTTGLGATETGAAFADFA